MKKHHLSLHRMDLLGPFKRRGGFMYSTPILLDGDTSDEPTRSKLVLFEDGQPLRRAHEQHSTVSGTGRGAYSHWERHVYFSASDNSDPNTNGRLYSFAVDHVGQHEEQGSGFVALNPPFHRHEGHCWGVTVSDEGDDLTTGTASTLQVYEDESPLGPSHSFHPVIAAEGGGAYSHWQNYLYFSTSDGSDPNTNGRLYSYDIQD